MNYIEELDRLADEMYDEFGFMTCSEHERAAIGVALYKLNMKNTMDTQLIILALEQLRAQEVDHLSEMKRLSRLDRIDEQINMLRDKL